jgi:undecaprenyl diphosphate synthase
VKRTMEDHAASRWAIETRTALTRSTSSSQAIFDQLETCSSARDVSTASCPQSGKLDILVRTSNVKRLSDFMMWQVGAQERA